VLLKAGLPVADLAADLPAAMAVRVWTKNKPEMSY
jgi:hypothetical protein